MAVNLYCSYAKVIELLDYTSFLIFSKSFQFLRYNKFFTCDFVKDSSKSIIALNLSAYILIHTSGCKSVHSFMIWYSRSIISQLSRTILFGGGIQISQQSLHQSSYAESYSKSRGIFISFYGVGLEHDLKHTLQSFVPRTV